MGVLIRNTQKFLPLNLHHLHRQAKAVLRYVNLDDWSLCVWYCTLSKIHRYNLKYLNRDRPTDILSFPTYRATAPGQLPHVKNPLFRSLGDILICPEFVARQCQETDWPVHERLSCVFVHGVCHLMGYDHEADSDWEVMEAREEEILERLRTEFTSDKE